VIRERTGEGRKRALANGVKFGRKRKLSDYQRKEAIKRRDQSGFSVWPLLSGFSYAPCSMVWAMPLAAMMGRLRIDIKEGLA
jgi:hypothetical protein